MLAQFMTNEVEAIGMGGVLVNMPERADRLDQHGAAERFRQCDFPGRQSRGQNRERCHQEDRHVAFERQTVELIKQRAQLRLAPFRNLTGKGFDHQERDRFVFG